MRHWTTSFQLLRQDPHYGVIPAGWQSGLAAAAFGVDTLPQPDHLDRASLVARDDRGPLTETRTQNAQRQ
jgi:hypothetical protein